MIFQKHLPKLPLGKYVDCILYLEGNNKGAGFPKTNMSMVFNLNDSFKLYADNNFSAFTDYKKYWIAGLQTKPTYVESYGESKMIVVQFKTLGAFKFLNQPLRNFSDHYISLDDIFYKDADEIWEQLQASKTINDKILRVETFLYQKLFLQEKPSDKLLHQINLTITQSPNKNITSICQEYRISRKHLNHLFKEKIGISPKLLSSLYRLQSTFKTISKEKPAKLTNLAYQLDYFDQAHFNNDFKRFTNLTPSAYLKNVATTPSLKLIPHFLPFSD